MKIYSDVEEAAAQMADPVSLKAVSTGILQTISANAQENEQPSKKQAAKKKAGKVKRRVSFGGEKIRTYKPSPQPQKPRASMGFFPSLEEIDTAQEEDTVTHMMAEPALEPVEDLDGMTMDLTDMSIGMTMEFDTMELFGLDKDMGKSTMHNFDADMDLTQGLRAMVGDLAEPAPTEAEPEAHAEEEEDNDSSAMDFTCAAMPLVDAADTTEVQEEAAIANTMDDALVDDGIMDDDDDFLEDDATECMFAVPHGRASLGVMEIANLQAQAKKAAEAAPEMATPVPAEMPQIVLEKATPESAAEDDLEAESDNSGMDLTMGALGNLENLENLGPLTYNNTNFSEGSSLSAGSITDLYSNSHPLTAAAEAEQRKPRESLAGDEKTEHIFGAAKGVRRMSQRRSSMRRRSSMGMEQNTDSIFKAGMTQFLFDEVENIKQIASDVQSSRAQGATDASESHTSELARLVRENDGLKPQELGDKENLMPACDELDDDLDDEPIEFDDDEDKTEAFLLSRRQSVGGDLSGNFSAFMLGSNTTRHSTATLSELASKLQLTPLDVRPSNAQRAASMSLEYFLCQAKIHFVGISTMRKVSTCPVNIPYAELLGQDGSHNLTPFMHTKLIVEPQLESAKELNAAYEEQILAKLQSIEELSSELSRNNPRSFALAMQPESREVVVNCLKELKQKCRMDAKAQWYSQHLAGLERKQERLRATLRTLEEDTKGWEVALESLLSADMKNACPSTPELKAKYSTKSSQETERLEKQLAEQQDNFDILQGMQEWRMTGLNDEGHFQVLLSEAYELRFVTDKASGTVQEAHFSPLPAAVEASPLRAALVAAMDVPAYLQTVTAINQIPEAVQHLSLLCGRTEDIIEECEEVEQVHPNVNVSYAAGEGVAEVRVRFMPASAGSATLDAFSVSFSLHPSSYPYGAMELTIDNEKGGSSLSMERHGIASAAVQETAAKFCPPRCSFGRMRMTCAALADALYAH